ncbi:MAG: helix-turn-helix domain-containing protein [Methanomicrobiales archaeon]
MALSRGHTTRIIDILRKNPKGLSITEMVKKIGINRNTAGRYLETLLVSGQVEMRHFGMAKIYTLSNRTPQSAMFSISSDLVMQLDSGLRIVFANEPFLNLLEVTAPALFGKTFEYSAAGVVFEDTLEDFITILQSGIAGKEWHGTLLLNKGDRFFPAMSFLRSLMTGAKVSRSGSKISRSSGNASMHCRRAKPCCAASSAQLPWVLV